MTRERTRLLPRRGEVDLREGSADGSLPGLLRIRDRGVELEIELERAGRLHGALRERALGVLDAQAGRRARARHAAPRRRAAARDRGARRDRRLRRLPRARHRVALERGGRDAPRAARRSRGTWSAAINDPATGSERAVWVDGAPHEVAPGRVRRRPRARSAAPTARCCASTPRPSAAAATTC